MAAFESGTSILNQVRRILAGNAEAIAIVNPDGTPISGIFSANNPSVGVTGSAVPASATFLGVQDGSGNLQGVSSSNPLPVSQSGLFTVQPGNSQNTVPWLVTGAVSTVAAAPNVGQKVLNNTATQVTASSISSTNGILIQALSGNAASVYVGGSGVTTANGYELQPGQSVPFAATNANLLYGISTNGTDGVCFNVL